jgi:hypothetical protein
MCDPTIKRYLKTYRRVKFRAVPQASNKGRPSDDLKFIADLNEKSLPEFRKKVEGAINKVARCQSPPSDVRPFVCRGSPLRCKVFIVEYNPATPMKETHFWNDFWDDNIGFKYDKWSDAYKKARQLAGKNQQSTTRKKH